MFTRMANPTEALAAEMEGWKGTGLTPVEARGGTHPGDLEFWRRQAAMVAEIRALDARAEALTGGANFYAPATVQWYQTAFSFWADWDTRHQTIGGPPPEAMAMLRGLGVTMQHAGYARPALTSEQSSNLSETLDEAVRLLKDADSGLSDAERLYVLELLSATRRLVDESSLVDRVDLQRHIDQVMGAMTRLSSVYAEAGDTERGAKFTEVVRRVYEATRYFVYDAAAVAAIASASADIATALGGTPGA